MDYHMMATARPQMSEIEYAAILRLEENRDFKLLFDFIAKRAISVALLSVDKKGEELHWLQGRAQELRDLSNSIKNARANYELLRKAGGNK